MIFAFLCITVCEHDVQFALCDKRNPGRDGGHVVRHPLYIFVDEQIIQILLDGICVCLDGIPDFLNILLKQLIDDIVCLYNLFCQLKIFIMVCLMDEKASPR